MSNVWQGLLGDNLANIGDTVEAASITRFKVTEVKRDRVTGEWLYRLNGIDCDSAINNCPETELSKINGVII